MRTPLPVRRCVAVALVATAGASLAVPQSASALNPLKAGCALVGRAYPTAGKVCTAAGLAGRAVSAIKSLFGGHVGGAIKSLLGQAGSSAGSAAASAASTAVGLAAVGTWVLGGAKFTLHEVGVVLSHTTTPQLNSTWFSSTYWRVVGIAAVLTLPFLFAAAVQALIRSDITLLLRSVLGYLPLAMLAVAMAAPLTMLLLAASDQLAGAVSSAAGGASSHFLRLSAATIAGLTLVTRSPFMVFFVGLLTVAAAMALWIELLVREAAVYVIVLMLPLVFAALVWPARRMWALRSVELLIALIFSKFAIVAVLSLGGAALSSQGFSVSGLIAGVVLLGMGVFAPWALLRLVPLAELASSAATSLRSEGRAPVNAFLGKWGKADAAESWAMATAAMRRDSERGLAVGTDRPVAEPRHTSGAPGNGSRSAQADPELAEAELPIPEPDAPDLTQPERSPGAAQPAESIVSATVTPRPGQRIPGLPEMWQQDDLSWNPVILGPEGALGQRPWPPPGSQFGRKPDDPERRPSPASGQGADDHDPTPPGQGPAEGRL